MDRTQVNSSNIASIGYDSHNHILEVEFHNGSIYHYLNVPASIYDELMEANSHGKYLNSMIKGTYQYQRVN